MRYGLGLKIMAPLVLTTTVVMLSLGVAASNAMQHEIELGAKGQVDGAMRQIVTSLEANDTLVTEQVHSALKLLETDGLAGGKPRLGDRIRVGDRTVHNLILSGRPAANRFELVDRVKAVMGGTATLFVKDGRDFVRVSTNVVKANGQRAVGTVLDPRGKAYAAVSAGQAFYGVVEILGKPYLTGYAPMRDAAGATVGVWYVGYQLAGLDALEKAVAGSHILEHGFIALRDGHDRTLFGSKNLLPAAIDAQIAAQSPNWRLERKAFSPWHYAVVAGYPQADVEARLVGIRLGALLGSLFAALLMIGVASWLIRRFVVRPIRELAGAAALIAEGDLEVTVDVRSTDELGALAAAFATMTAYLQEVAGVARAIGEGDLGVTVTPKGDRDRFGSAIAQMVATLNRIVGRVASAAELLERSAGHTEQASSEIFAVAEEMAAASNQVADNANALAANVEETAASMEEMAAHIQQVAGSARHAKENADRAAVSAGTGHAAVEATVAGMAKIERVMGEVIQTIEGLGNRSDAIGDIVGLIQEIADQTNLLALNAAIEAARAGDHGRGFAVVADEVRKLAERSSKATHEIGGLIKGIQSETARVVDSARQGSSAIVEGVALTHEAGGAIGEIVEAVGHATNLMGQIAQAAQEQGLASRQIGTAVGNMNGLTRQVANASSEQQRGANQVVTSADQINRLARGVHEEARGLQEAVAFFQASPAEGGVRVNMVVLAAGDEAPGAGAERVVSASRRA